MHDVTVLGSFFAGVAAYRAQMRRVTFRNCKINTLNLRSADLREVRFEGCGIDEIDVGGATLRDV